MTEPHSKEIKASKEEYLAQVEVVHILAVFVYSSSIIVDHSSDRYRMSNQCFRNAVKLVSE